MKKSKEIVLSSVFLTAVAGSLQAQEVHVSANDVNTPPPADTMVQNHIVVTGHSRFYWFFHWGHGHHSGSAPLRPNRPEPTNNTGSNSNGGTTKNGFGNSMRSSGHS
jgi:hypothetical protein